jgi:hypothetical protein
LDFIPAPRPHEASGLDSMTASRQPQPPKRPAQRHAIS